MRLALNQTPLVDIGDRVRHYTANSKADATHAAYESDWRGFTAFCTPRGYQAMPADAHAVAAYMAHMADNGKKASTIARRLAAIRFAHKLAGEPTPTTHPLVEEAMAGIRRAIGTAPKQARAATVDVIRAMVAACPDTFMGIRDRAMILVGFAGAFRESELVGITVEDLDWRDGGVRITLRRSKTDQQGAGTYKDIAPGAHPLTCPVTALKRWLGVMGIERGPVFRSTLADVDEAKPLRAVTVIDIVRRAARLAGLDPAGYSGHSLRAGFVTQAATDNVPLYDIMDGTGHKDPRTVQRYIRRARSMAEAPSGKVGL